MTMNVSLDVMLDLIELKEEIGRIGREHEEMRQTLEHISKFSPVNMETNSVDSHSVAYAAQLAQEALATLNKGKREL